MDDELLYSVDGGVARLTFNRPRARNALTFAMYDRLAEICRELSADPGGVHAVIITGAGDRAFAAGTDISSFRDFETAEDALGYERRMDAVLGDLEAVPVTTIAAIRGACTGGGAGIAAACDLRIAAPDLKFGFPIARTLGNCLSVGNLSRLVALLGAARTREVIFTARLIEADEALRLGLVSEIHDDVLERAEELATLVGGHAPLTLRATKEALRRMREKTAEVDADDLIVQCYTSDDFREGLEAFLAKRSPRWSGR